jgi:hypothetical protein
MGSLGSGGGETAGRGSSADLIAWVLALEERDQLDARDCARLDREIQARLSEAETGGRGALRAWLAEAPTEALRVRIVRVRTSLSLLKWLFLGVGAFFGWAAAATLLQVEVHAGRVNVVLCVGLLVIVPLAMSVLGCAGVWWSARSASSASGLAEGGGWRSYAMSRMVMSLLSTSVREDVEIVLGRLTANSKLYSRVQRAQIFVWSQSFGFAFTSGALVATLAFVVFTDLAFGWSTTLDVAASNLHGLVRVISAPWALLWPDASPPLDLIETTRHFRVSRVEQIHAVDPIQYGGWWPFLVASLAFYGLVPRSLFVAIGSRWLGREVGEAILRTPGMDSLLGRMTMPLIESQATTPEGEVGYAERGLVATIRVSDWLRESGGEEPMVIRWAEASEDEALMAALGVARLLVRDAGGRRSIQEDADLVASVSSGEGGIALCVRAYEPPVLDVLDFVSDLRRAIGERRGLCLLLLEGTESDHVAWRNKLMGLGDPGLRVAPLSVEADGEEVSR